MRNKIFLYFYIFIVLSLTGCVSQTEMIKVEKNSKLIINNAVEDNPVATATDNIKSKIEPQSIEIPVKLDLKAPFVSQAPLRNWDPPYNEACEEASMLSVAKYFNKTAIDSQTINQELLALIKWEKINNYKVDVNAQEVVQILKDYFGLKARLETKVTVDQIKYELNQGHLIIIPTSGRTLGNPYFRTPGPIYHMLVIRGYDRDQFITNDVGTNTKGEAFKYKYQTILDSVHDWNHKMMADGQMTDTEMAQGRKVMIVVSFD